MSAETRRLFQTMVIITMCTKPSNDNYAIRMQIAHFDRANGFVIHQTKPKIGSEKLMAGRTGVQRDRSKRP